KTHPNATTPSHQHTDPPRPTPKPPEKPPPTPTCPPTATKDCSPTWAPSPATKSTSPAPTTPYPRLPSPPTPNAEHSNSSAPPSPSPCSSQNKPPTNNEPPAQPGARHSRRSNFGLTAGLISHSSNSRCTSAHWFAVGCPLRTSLSACHISRRARCQSAVEKNCPSTDWASAAHT